LNNESRLASEYESACPPWTIEASALRSDEMGPKTWPGRIFAVLQHVGRLLDGLCELFRLSQVLHDQLGVIQKLSDFGCERTAPRRLRSLNRDCKQRHYGNYAFAH
jgi:hypothetical protein